MNAGILIPFAFGFLTAMSVGVAVHILAGMKLNLYFLNQELQVTDEELLKDQGIIPITAETKKASLWNMLRRGTWREDVEIVLLDHDGTAYSFLIGYGLWRRYFVILTNKPNKQVQINFHAIEPGKSYPLRTGMRLGAGDRAFNVLVTPRTVQSVFYKELSASAGSPNPRTYQI